MLKSILNLEGVQSLSKNEQKNVSGGFGSLPIAGFCETFQGCINSCTAGGTVCAPCLDNNAASGTYECRFVGITLG